MFGFFGKFGVLCFFETPVLRFALSPYYRRSDCVDFLHVVRHLQKLQINRVILVGFCQASLGIF